MAPKNENSSVRIWCGPDKPPNQDSFRYTSTLNTIPPNQNVYLKAQNISARLAHDIDSICLDLLEIASYVYAADQSKTRGGATFPNNGTNWYRQFELSIPVRNEEIWNKPEVSEKLTELLRFMADDDYHFIFRKLNQDVPRDAYFEFDEGTPWFKPDSILLFSGGLDSLAGAVNELQDTDKKILLVSHRSVSKIDKPQRDLVSGLRRHLNVGSRLLHIPVWVNKQSGITKDANQRSRSFLYASIAAVIASMTGLRIIKFYENGIISTNLPISGQVIGARASHSTHPQTLRLMSELFTLIFGNKFEVVNPFFFKTKSEVINPLKDSSTRELIQISRSCTKTMSSTRLHTHCGTCSQCIERRIAILFNRLEEFDPEVMYQTKLFLDELKLKEDRMMVESYIRHARSLEELDINSFYEQFPDGLSLIREIDKPIGEAANLLYDLHKRHGTQVANVIDSQIKLNADDIRKGNIQPGSLLGMIIGKSGKDKQEDKPLRTFPTPPGTKWHNVTISIMSKDSLKIEVGGISERFTYAEIGFKDNRKGDMPDGNWDALLVFAEYNGVIDKHTNINPILKHNLKSRVKVIRYRLKRLMNMEDDPFAPFKKHQAYKLIPPIKDLSY